MARLRNLTSFQADALRDIAACDPLLNITVNATTAEVPHVSETLDAVYGAIGRNKERGLGNALHSVKRKLKAIEAS